MPSIIAHRGASVEAPENTLRAFERAIGIGADRIELDLRRTADGGIVVVHDRHLSRLCGVDTEVHAMRLDELTPLHVLDEDFPAGPDTCIPGLEEVLSRIAPRCPLYLELKTDGLADPAEFARDVLDLVPAGSGHMVASFDSRVVGQALARGTSTVLIANSLRDLDALDKKLHPRLSALSLRHDQVDERAGVRCAELGIALWTWTVDTPSEWSALQAYPAANAWCTNDPRALRHWLDGRQPS